MVNSNLTEVWGRLRGRLLLLSQGRLLIFPPPPTLTQKDWVFTSGRFLVPGLWNRDCAYPTGEVKVLRNALELVQEARLVPQPWSLQCKYTWRFCCGPCPPGWLSLLLSSRVKVRGTHIPKGWRLTSLSFLRIQRPSRSRRQLYCSTKEWDPLSHEAYAEPLSLRCGADPALHLR